MESTGALALGLALASWERRSDTHRRSTAEPEGEGGRVSALPFAFGFSLYGVDGVGRSLFWPLRSAWDPPPIFLVHGTRNTTVGIHAERLDKT